MFKRSTFCGEGSCVEVDAQWRRASFCAVGNCVEVAGQWHRASSCAEGACVEVTDHAGEVLVRDSKNPQQEPLRFTAEEWSAFAAGMKNGEFDFEQA